MTTWNLADLLNIGLSNGDLTATNSVSANTYVRSTTSKSSGFWYWEIAIDVYGGGFETPGIANAAYLVSQNIPGFDSGANSLGLYLGGGAGVQAFVGGGIVGSVGGGGAVGQVGDKVAFCLKPPTNEIWGRLWRSSAWFNDWNATPGADPATSAGGITMTGLNPGPLFIVVGGQNTGDRVTLNPGPSGFIPGMPPSGVLAWDSAGPPQTLIAARFVEDGRKRGIPVLR